MYCGGELPPLGAPPPSESADPSPTAAPALDPAALAMLEQLERRAKPKADAPETRAPRKLPKLPKLPRFPSLPKRERAAPVAKARAGKKKKGKAAPTVTLLADAPPPPKTYAEALVRGGGPFGNRDTVACVVLHPHPDYKPKIAWLKHRLANTLGVDLYTAVQALQRDVPRALAFLDSEEEAAAAACHLREGGLHAGVLLRSTIEAWDGPLEVVAMTANEDDAVGFRTTDGDEVAVLRSAVRVAILGRLEPDAQERGGGTLGRGGGPYTALDLLVRGSRRPIRVRSDKFDFRSVGEHVGISALVNLKALAAELGPGRGPVPLDERFKRVPHFAALAREKGATEAPLFLRRELEFAEYGLVVDLAVP